MENSKSTEKVPGKNQKLTKKVGQLSSEPKLPVAFRAPESLVLQLDAMAARQGVDRSTLILLFLEKGFLRVSTAEIIGQAIVKIEAANRIDHAFFSALDDIDGRLEAIEKAVKTPGIVR